MSLLSLSRHLASRWKLIAAIALAGALLAAGWSLIARPRFRSTLKFALEEANINPALGGLAAITGQLGASGLAGARSLQFYEDVLTSESMLRATLTDSFVNPESGALAPLVDILELPGDSPRERVEAGVQFLRTKAVGTSTNDRTGTITLTVALPDPELAASVADRLYSRLGQFNLEARRTAASERRRFAQREVDKARGQLATAEAEMRSFLNANRGGLESPRLVFQRQGLQRRLDIANEVYGRLVRELEDARMDEVRDTPVFTLVEEAVPPLRREYPARTRMTLMGGVLAAAVAVAALTLLTVWRSARREDALASGH